MVESRSVHSSSHTAIVFNGLQQNGNKHCSKGLPPHSSKITQRTWQEDELVRLRILRFPFSPFKEQGLEMFDTGGNKLIAKISKPGEVDSAQQQNNIYTISIISGSSKS